jgi:hypothetical protein
MARAWVIGNGPSILKTPLEKLEGERTFGVNRIWRLFDHTNWRPTDYVRAELPEYDGTMVQQDLIKMAPSPSKLWVQAGFFRYAARMDIVFGRPVTPFLTCNGDSSHDWHLDLGDYLCGFGTVVQMAIQIAVLEGADHVLLLGCDLGNDHFYGVEGKDNTSRNVAAHENALRCSPVPIYNCTIGGNLEVYPRLSMNDVLSGGDGFLKEQDLKQSEHKAWLYGKVHSGA